MWFPLDKLQARCYWRQHRERKLRHENQEGWVEEGWSRAGGLKPGLRDHQSGPMLVILASSCIDPRPVNGSTGHH